MVGARFLFLVAAVVLPAGCESPATSGRPAGPPPPPGCEIGPQGPLVGYTYQNAPPPSPLGGAITDGVYDLVQVVKFTPNAGPWTSNMAPAFRWTMRFTTDERSPNHAAGRTSTAIEIPPAVQCESSRFATFQTELRSLGGEKGITSTGYTATPDTLTIIEPRGDGGAPLAYFFRRR